MTADCPVDRDRDIVEGPRPLPRLLARARRVGTAADAADKGAATLEVVIVAPGVLLLILLLALGGRTAIAKNAVTDAAWEAARAASIARTPARARSEASNAALSYLAQQNLRCQGLSVSVDTAGFSVPVGQPASVHVTVRCPLDLSGISLPGLNSRTLTAESTSPLDTFRER